MRLWLTLAALAALVLAEPRGVDVVKEVLNSYDPSQPIREVDDSAQEFHEEIHSRHKRSLAPAGSFFMPPQQCQTTGYTGEYCLNPICQQTNWNVDEPDNSDGQGALIDVALLINCTQNYVLLVDEVMFNIKIQVYSTRRVNPMFTLISPNGTSVAPTSILLEDSQHFEAYFNDLVAGHYVVMPSSDIAISNCNLVVEANTFLNVVAGFTSGDYMERSDFPQTVAYVNTPSRVVAHMFGGMGAAKIAVVNIFSVDNVVYKPKALQSRYKCMYEYFAEYTCYNSAASYMVFEGITFGGNSFRRVVPFLCANPPVTPSIAPPTPTTPAPPLTRCANNGVLIHNLDNSTYCFCQGLFTGKDCSQLICMNGGTLTSDNNCDCPSSYGGAHCQNVVCADDANFGFDAEHPTLTYIIRTRAQNTDIIKQVIDATTTYINSLSFDATYIQEYILVLFNNNALLFEQRFISFEDMLAVLANAANATATDGGCDDSVFSAISSALNMYPNNKSPVYVFTDATPNDLKQTNVVLSQLSFWRNPLTIFFMPPPPSCQFTADNPAYRALDNLAKASGGIVLYINERKTVEMLLLQHMISTIYRSQLMLSNDIDVCNNQNAFKTVSIDQSVDQMTIVATGANLNLTVTAPSKSPVRLISVYTDGVNFIWSINGVELGNYLFDFRTQQLNGPCNFKIYQKAYDQPGPRPQTSDLFWAFTGAIDGDGELVQPLYGFNLAITAHLTNYLVFTNQPEYVHSEMTIYASRQGKQVQVYASNGIWRDGCTYNFYFPPFTCQVADETLYFNFYARDQRGSPIQRAGVMSCMQFTPTPHPPTTCQNGGVMAPDNTTCYCPPTFTGTHCQDIVCFNGGTPAGSSCKCAPGWGDQFCTLPVCTIKGPNPEFLRNYVDMIFAVELTSQGFPQISSLNTYFAELLRDIQSQDSQWIANYVLVGFNSTFGDVLHVSPSWNPNGIINALNKLASTPPKDTGCRVQLYRALDNAVRRRDTAPGSYIQIFQTSPADESERGGWSEAYEYSRQMDLVINGFLSFSPRNPSGFACNATQENFQYLFDLVAGSTGVVYPTQAGLISDIIRVIPLQYSSGLVYAQWQMDCTQGMNVFFPIDSYTQTIQLNVVGINSQISVLDANQNAVETFSILKDSYSNWNILEIRKPCDDGWQEAGQYCVHFSLDQLSYTDAQKYCASSGGMLVDDLTQNKHSFLQQAAQNHKFWTGLYNNGSEYLWDRGNNPATALSQTNTYWSTGTAPPYDATKACVFFDPFQQNGNSWVLDDCSVKKIYVCQRHRYDQNNPPTSLDSDDLPAGKWTVKVTSQNNGSFGGCYVEARVQSSLQIVTGFANNVAEDWPLNDPTQDSPNNMMITYVHSKDNENRIPILTHALLWDAYNGTFYDAAQYTIRLGCSYPWVTQNFQCPNSDSQMNEFGITHMGEDEFGNLFQRITFGHCSPKVLTCGNGGIRTNGTCVCDEYWTGKFCTVPICVNNGTLDSSEAFCHCPRGFGGPNCQLDECEPHRHHSFTASGKTMVIVLEVTQQNQDAVNQLANNFTSIIQQATTQDPNWITSYILVMFDSKQVIYSYYTFIDALSVQQAIKMQATSIKDPGNCKSNIYQALNVALQKEDLITIPNSLILLFTASTAADLATRWPAVDAVGYSEAQLHWFYSTSDTCGQYPQDASVGHLVPLTYATNGNTQYIVGNMLAQVLSSYLPTIYQNNVLMTPTSMTNFTCASSQSWYVQVDGNTSYIYATTTSDIGTIGAIDPFNQMIIPQLVYTSGDTKLYKIMTDITGTYTFSLVSPGSCFVNIYSVGGATVYSYYAPTTTSDPTGEHQDGLNARPVAGVSTVAVFHAEPRRERAQLQYIQVFDPILNQVLLGAPLYIRSGESCTFEYYSDPFVCQSDFINVIVYGLDENYNPFVRQIPAFCATGGAPGNGTTSAPVTMKTTPAPVKTTQVPPKTTQVPAKTTQVPVTQAKTTQVPVMTTQGGQTKQTGAPTTRMTPAPTTSFGNANIQFDVVFLLDLSKSATNLYDDMSSFIMQLMSPYDLTANAHVGIVPVFGNSGWDATAIANLNTIHSQTMLSDYLGQAKSAYSDFDDAGQYLAKSLATVTNVNFLQSSTGYRSSINNHLLIYVTTTSSFSDNPSTASILKNNTYGVLTIGYGSGVTDTNAMQTLAGGQSCSFFAATASDLTKSVPDVQAMIWNGYTSNGKYCGN